MDLRVDPRQHIPKVPDVRDPGIKTPEKVTGQKPKGAPRPNYFTLILTHIPMATIVKRLSARTPFVGKLIMAIGGLLGIGGLAATEYLGHQLTGDTYVDIAILISATVLAILAGKAQVDPETKAQIEKEEA